MMTINIFCDGILFEEKDCVKFVLWSDIKCFKKTSTWENQGPMLSFSTNKTFLNDKDSICFQFESYKTLEHVYEEVLEHFKVWLSRKDDENEVRGVTNDRMDKLIEAIQFLPSTSIEGGKFYKEAASSFANK